MSSARTWAPGARWSPSGPHATASPQVVELLQRRPIDGGHLQEFAPEAGLAGVRVDCDRTDGSVVGHRREPHGSAARDGRQRPAGRDRARAGIECSLADERSDSSAAVAPWPPNWGPRTRGSAPSIAALGSPVTPHAGKPPLSTSCGLAPKKAGPPQHDVGELAHLEAADVVGEPVDDRRVDGELRQVAQDPLVVVAVLGSRPRSTEASPNVRRQVSPARPMPWASDEVTGMTPRSWSTFSARHRGAARPASAAICSVAGQVRASGRGWRGSCRGARRRRRAVRAGSGSSTTPSTLVDAGELEHVRGVPAAAALDVVRVDGAAVEDASSVSATDRLSLSPSVCSATCDVELLGHAKRGVEGAQVRAGVLVHLEPAHAAPRAPRAGERRADDDPRPSRPMLTGYVVEGGDAVRRTQAEPTPTPQNGPTSCPMIVVTPEESSASHDPRRRAGARGCRCRPAWR